MSSKSNEFFKIGKQEENHWRGITLLGSNTTSFKFALAKSLIGFASTETDIITLEELAKPFSEFICEHLAESDRQGTNPTSTFLQECRNFNLGKIDYDKLYSTCISQGFRYVFDAFHKVSGEETPTKFFQVTGSGRNRSVRLADNLINLASSTQGTNFAVEVEARWKVVESAWELGINPGLISTDNDGNLILIQESKRRSVTGVKEAISGYQKGRCFYCREEFLLHQNTIGSIEVDHFFPISRQDMLEDSVDLDQIWNMVLACRECNRGQNGKFDRIPDKQYLERLVSRSNYYISSNDPLKDHLQRVTGRTVAARARFHRSLWQELESYGGKVWSTAAARDSSL